MKKSSLLCTIYFICFLKVKYFFRYIDCLLFGHMSKCYLPPATEDDEIRYHKTIKELGFEPRVFWRKLGNGWCCWCGTHTKEPVRLRKN